ncbi:hypothetical protein ACFVYP_03155 [Kitasatospora sp. NPDC058201]|uniref:hypothetical protein n=1 Tax=unclassified Kitasatospora TaxID=2633591 RepID=UPI0036634E69
MTNETPAAPTPASEGAPGRPTLGQLADHTDDFLVDLVRRVGLAHDRPGALSQAGFHSSI